MNVDSLFRFAFKMTPRRQGGSDEGIHLTYVEELTTQPTKGPLECEAELCVLGVCLSFEPCLNFTLPLLSQGVYITGDGYILRIRPGTYFAEIKFNTLIVRHFKTKGFWP
jgi:hypothetical protein